MAFSKAINNTPFILFDGSGYPVFEINPGTPPFLISRDYSTAYTVTNPDAFLYTMLRDGKIYFGRSEVDGSIVNVADDGSISPELNVNGSLILVSPELGANDDQVELRLQSGNYGVTNPYVRIDGDNGGSVGEADLYVTGSAIKLDLGLPGLEFWHTVSAIGYSGGWDGGAGTYQELSYRKDAEDNLHIAGVARNTGAASFSIFTLPAGWRPSLNYRQPAIVDNGFGAEVAAYFEVLASGAVQMQPFPTAGNYAYFNAIIPLNNIA